ncbi:protein-export membrane protein SecD [Oleispira antarctica]|uniref:Protein translocase subunit SecD n=1 Tax=Oleispira antarctica TaxID=188908 RepID=A0A1Y5HKT7_OLEAN|nr:protein-export membrane protein SecD [Oleispira antarctica]
MLNKYPLWKNLLIVMVLALAVIYSVPNLYPPDPAIQITPSQAGAELSERSLEKIRENLTENNIDFFGEELVGTTVLYRLTDNEQQLPAKDKLQRMLGDDFVVALNRAPTTPQWLLDMGAGPMTLGLDLSGGVHFLMEVDMESYMKGQMKNYQAEVKRQLREENIKYRRVTIEKNSLRIAFKTEELQDKADTFLGREMKNFRASTVSNTSNDVILALTEQKVKDLQSYAVKQNLTTIRNRVNELGVAEPLVQRQGANRIVVQLPGVQDTATAKKVLGKAANLSFRLEAEPDASRFSSEEYQFRTNEFRSARVEKKEIISGDRVTNAKPSFDENGQPQVNIDLDSTGANIMAKVTRNAIKRRMAVLFIEQKPTTRYVMEDGKEVAVTKYTETRGIISLATIQSQLGNSFRITGLEPAEASELALLLRAGALAAPMYFVEERTVGPSLGKDNIEQGVMSVLVGLALVLVFMMVFYRLFGFFANVALFFNLVILIALMSLIGATLTLPGIAGIVLTVGMAVDANVLIFSRIREELNAGRSPQHAIHEGYNRAFVTIFDANITTLIVAVILFGAGTGPVKGFAVTLSLGIITSMFTAIVLTRALVNATYGGRRIETLSIGGLDKNVVNDSAVTAGETK